MYCSLHAGAGIRHAIIPGVADHAAVATSAGMTATWRIHSTRMQRAVHLKTEYPFAAEILTFYERICALQQSLSADLQPVLRTERQQLARISAKISR